MIAKSTVHNENFNFRYACIFRYDSEFSLSSIIVKFRYDSENHCA